MRTLLMRFATLTLILLSMFCILASPLAAGSENILGQCLTDRELDQIRGGYLGGFSFGITFSGYWNNLGEMAGSLVYNGELPAGTTPPPGGIGSQISGDGAVIQAYVGNFQGASGIFQISQSPGSYNVIQNNMMVQITLINVTSEASLSALRAYLPSY